MNVSCHTKITFQYSWFFFIDNLFKKVDLGMDYKRGHRNVLLKSFNDETKFITGYEHKVNGEVCCAA